MKREKLKKAIPTVMSYLEKREKAAQNQLPKHLRPLSTRPIYFQMGLNAFIICTLSWLMLSRDEFMTEAAPAVGLVVCLLVLIYSIISAMKLKLRFRQLPGYRWARINFWMMLLAGLMLPASVAFFLP